MHKRVVFPGKALPLLLLTPQLLVTLIFFIWPAGQAIFQSFLIEDAFGLSYQFVWFENYADLFQDPLYLKSFITTLAFAAAVTALSMGLALLLAVKADRVVKSAKIYQSILVWPYAVAPAIAGILWFFLFNPSVGILAYIMRVLGYDWNHYLNGSDGFILVVIAAAWKQISYNFLFFLAGLQAIPKSLIEAAAIDGAGPSRRFWTIIFPLLSPTTFFLLVINVVYVFFDTFGIIHATTHGGPANATATLVYKVYTDGFIGLDLGGSAAQSVILMVMVIALTMVQFKYIERKVQY